MINRKELVLATLAAADGARFTPVQLQKAIFLLDRNLPADLLDTKFGFVPYDYGPFDAAVYHETEGLSRIGSAEITIAPGGRWKTYSASRKGIDEGKTILAKLPPSSRKYVEDVSAWVRSLSFSSLVKSIYSAYPETKANSIFSE